MGIAQAKEWITWYECPVADDAFGFALASLFLEGMLGSLWIKGVIGLGINNFDD